MAAVTFDVAFDRLIGSEGGYVNDPQDPGGETNWGISKRAYPDLDIASLTRDQAREIYRRDLWEKHQLERMPGELAFQVFDFATNSGIETAVRKLQAAAGAADDGHIGPVTLEAIAAANETLLSVRYLAERLRFLAKLSTWPRFGAGWANRIARDLIYVVDDESINPS